MKYCKPQWRLSFKLLPNTLFIFCYFERRISVNTKWQIWFEKTDFWTRSLGRKLEEVPGLWGKVFFVQSRFSSLIIMSRGVWTVSERNILVGVTCYLGLYDFGFYHKTDFISKLKNTITYISLECGYKYNYRKFSLMPLIKAGSTDVMVTFWRHRKEHTKFRCGTNHLWHFKSCRFWWPIFICLLDPFGLHRRCLFSDLLTNCPFCWSPSIF